MTVMILKIFLLKKTLCEITKELYDYIVKNSENKDVNRKYSSLFCSQDSSGEYKYYARDASLVGGEWKNIRYNVVYPKITDFLDSEYKSDFDIDAGDYGYWEVDFNCEDYHTPSYITLREFEDANYDNYISKKCKIPVDFYKAFCNFGGVMPKEFRVENSKVSTLADAFQEAVEPTLTISWGQDMTFKNDDLLLGIEELKNIADKYNIKDHNNIRIIFAFDN